MKQSDKNETKHTVMKFPLLWKAAATIASSLLLLSANTTDSSACTNIIVGKKASADGSVICTYNCDGFGFSGSMKYTPAGAHEKGEKIAIRTWGSGPIKGYVDQVDYTYGVIGYINDHQVSIVETTFGGRDELQNPEGILDYDTMMHLALERSASAREAIIVMGNLLRDYGYNQTGETITVCDKDEAWIFEVIGKGPGRKGAVWVAVRIPDDCISAHANISRIREFPQTRKADKATGFHIVEGECIYSPDVISFAREMGYYSGTDENFSFRDAYCPISFEKVRYADARVWSFFRHHYDKETMDSYLPYINGEFDKCDHLPLYIKPDKPLSVRDVMEDMRDHYEGTPLDMTADMSAGPWGMPVRPRPMNYTTSNGNTYFMERPIGTQQSGFTLVSQLRGWLPDPVGGIMYFNCDDASMVAYVPVFCGATEVPEAFRSENNPHNEFSWKSAFWVNNLVANMVYPRYSQMKDDLKKAQKQLEDYYAEEVAALPDAVKDMTRREMVSFLNGKSAQYTRRMMERWEELFRFLVVKFNDQVVRNEKDGVFTGGYTTPGYDPVFNEAIGSSTGDRYRVKTESSAAEANAQTNAL